MKKFCLAGAALISASCTTAGTDPELTDQVNVGGHSLTLTTSKDACFLHYSDESSPANKQMVPTPPCFFLRDEDGKPQWFAYEDAGVEATLIVVGTPISDEKRAEWGLPASAVCGEVAQGVLVTEDGVTATSKTLDAVVRCRDYGADEKDFWFFAH